MKIAFWSNVHGQPRTTSNMVAVSIAATLEYGQSCLVTQTHFNLNNLEAYFIGNRENSQDIFMDIGIDGLARSMILAPIGKETIENYSIPLLHNKLVLLPGTTSANKEVFHKEMAGTICRILKEAEKYFDLVFIDINSGEDEVSKLVLEQADVIVVNLCQNRCMLDNYFSKGLIKDKKSMFLIGNYDRNSVYNLHNLKKLYRPLSKGIISAIPYNTGFMDAQSDGSVMKYMRKKLVLEKNGVNNYFIESIKDAVEKLMKITGNKKGGRSLWQKIS
ncbi:MAG TPA: hypothetical protein VJ888_09670 [Mobilitalea sp.]|nr:hypothetical protein [Mobilitalea sp.]